MILLLLLPLDRGVKNPVTQTLEYDLVEVNTFPFDGKDFTQVILWRWRVDLKRYTLVDWCMADKCGVPQKVGKYWVIRYKNVKIVCKNYTRTRTDADPEKENSRKYGYEERKRPSAANHFSDRITPVAVKSCRYGRMMEKLSDPDFICEVLRMHEAGLSVSDIAQEMKASWREVKNAIMEKVPVFSEADLHKCPGCNSMIVIKPCMICYAKRGIKNGLRD